MKLAFMLLSLLLWATSVFPTQECLGRQNTKYGDLKRFSYMNRQDGCGNVLTAKIRFRNKLYPKRESVYCLIDTLYLVQGADGIKRITLADVAADPDAKMIMQVRKISVSHDGRIVTWIVVDELVIVKVWPPYVP